MEKAEIIVIGDELLIGQVVDTNSGMIAGQLNMLGIAVERTTAVHDSEYAITSALDEAFSRVGLVLMTGGLGPTKDDITKTTLCKFFHTRLVEDPAVKQHILQLYSDRPQVLNSLTATQWQVPEACQVLENRVGSAPLMEFCKDGKLLYSMPGVPYEAEVAMQEQIVPRLRSMVQTNVILHRTLIVYGIPESSLALLIADWEDALPEYMHLAYLPSNRMIRLRLTASVHTDKHSLEAEMSARLDALKPLIHDYLIAEEDKPIEVLVGELLKKRGETVSSAESCTGGKVAMLLNKHAGSSSFYYGTVVAYDNSVKQKVLGVKSDTLESVGAVSEQTVAEMANGVRALLGTTWGVATSGIAGPDGGTKEKPVGTVWIAVSNENATIAQCCHFRGSRDQITTHAATAALILLLQQLKK
ncbi:MAG: CinA family nicotinamide mononucleotide deamidase-related protein [Paludibacteraceae bacterium]|nr:CinA family nicotinamide mononucleotide deamidase-related protein [Paludibacteraceae bacterium]